MESKKDPTVQASVHLNGESFILSDESQVIPEFTSDELISITIKNDSDEICIKFSKADPNSKKEKSSKESNKEESNKDQSTNE